MLPTQNFRVEVSGILCGNSPGICLSSDLHALIIGKVYVFYEGISIEGVQIQSEESVFQSWMKSKAAESNKLCEH